MAALNEPYNRQSLIHTLQRTHAEVTDTFKALGLDDFYRHPGRGWSPAETLNHLTKSGRELRKSMRLPRIVLRLLYGKNDVPSRQYHQMRDRYQAQLARGFRAENGKSSLAPDKITTPTSQRDAEDTRKKLLQEWRDVSKALVKCVEGWHEMYLEGYRLPHPAFGKISVREMLMVAIYHDLHHLLKVRQAHPRKKSHKR